MSRNSVSPHRRLRFLCCVVVFSSAIFASWCTAFVPYYQHVGQLTRNNPVNTDSYSCYSSTHHDMNVFGTRRIPTASRSTLLRCSMVAEETQDKTTSSSEESSHPQSNNSIGSFLSIESFNRDLDRLAEQCGDAREKNAVAIAAKCEDMFHQLQQQQQAADADSSSNQLIPDIVTFNTVLKAWSKTAHTMSQQRQAFNSYAAPSSSPTTTDDKNAIVPVYTARDAAERVTKLLVEMEQQNEQNDDNAIVPDRFSYNVAIDAWAKSRSMDAPQATERLLKRMMDHETIEPDSLSYNGVIDAWAHALRIPDSMDKVHKIYQHMQQVYQENNDDNYNNNTIVKPTIRTINTIIHGHAKRVGDTKHYNKEDSLAEATKAHELLKEMKAKYEETNDEDFLPDVMTYTSVMDAYGRCGQLEATQRAEELLKELEEWYIQQDENPKCAPNFRTYTSLITAWSKTRHPDSPKRGEELLQRMEELYQERMASGIPLQPNEETTKPNARTYTGVIQCWGKSRDNTKAQRVLRILKKMKEMYKVDGNVDARPNLITYNSAIDACAHTQGTSAQQTEALKIAFAMFKSLEMEDHIRPNHVTYSTLMRAAAFLMPAGPERNTVAKTLFAKAQKAGMVDRSIFKYLHMAVDNQVMHDLLKDMEDKKGNLDYNKIPASWRKHVR